MTQQAYVGAGSGLRLQRPPGAFPRVGAWAIYEGRVGVLAEVRELTAEFHVVDARGHTTMTIPGVPLRALTQATFEQIPAPRRPLEPIARKLGYLDGPSPAITIAVAEIVAPIVVTPPRRSFVARVLATLTRRSTAGG